MPELWFMALYVLCVWPFFFGDGILGCGHKYAHTLMSHD